MNQTIGNGGMDKGVSHSGIVESIQGNCVKVRIVQASACAACKVASHCHASEQKVKLVDVVCADGSAYRVGQEVTVWASSQVAARALLLGFGAPLLLMVSVLLVVLRLVGHEGTAALVALGSLIPYYILLWVMRGRIQRGVAFHIA